VSKAHPENKAGPVSPRPRLSVAWGRLRQDRSLKGREWSKAALNAADAWLTELFEEATGGAAGGIALVAVGSLGRGDLAPGSDLDLLLVHRGHPGITGLAEAIWYPVWDDPMPLDHSVRTLKQVGQAAEADLRVALGLLDARLVAGAPEVADELKRLSRRLWEKRAGKWLPALLEARAASQQAHGEVAFLLEPELQESKGGLRDAQVLDLLARVTPVAGQLAADPRLGRATELLHAVKVELQRPDGRRSERLALDDQARIASALGFSGREELAQAVAAAGRDIAWLVDDAARRASSWLAGPRGRAGTRDKALGPGLVARDGEVAVPLSTEIASDPTLALRAAKASAELGLPLARATMDRLAAEAPSPQEPWGHPTLRAFLGLISAGPVAVHAVETLDHLGVWERYMPEWPEVRNRPQFNPYHRWTVDRHLLESAAGAAQHMFEVRRPDLLVLGALLHDIGKGTGADHSQSGAGIAGRVAARLGLPPEDAALLRKLVLHHLLLPDVATRRDIDDPATAALVADAVEDVATLELLAALAAADGTATGPAAWGPWKAQLVADLAQRVEAVLEGRPVPPGPPFPSEELLRLMEAGGVQVLPRGRELVVVAPDRPGLFSDLTGALALAGLNITEARAHSQEGTALDVFALDFPEGAPPHWERVLPSLEAAASKRLAVEEALSRRPLPRSARRALALAAAPVILVDNDAASAATVVEVRAPDAPGLLHRVAATFAAFGLDISSARVSTVGTAVVDTFYVTKDGGKLRGASEADLLRHALEGALLPSGGDRNTPET
jgi:[protein-PII] uridylyltransferase